jgi:hypothetical protein
MVEAIFRFSSPMIRGEYPPEIVAVLALTASKKRCEKTDKLRGLNRGCLIPPDGSEP